MRTGLLTVALSAAIVLSAGCKKKLPEEEPVVADVPDQADPDTESPDSPAEPARSQAGPEMLARAVAYLSEDRPESARKALEILEKAAASDPDNVVIKFNLGLAHLQLGQLPRAETRFFEATRMDSSFGPAWLGLGLVQERTGSVGSAVDTYRKGIAADGENMALRAALVGALRRTGRFAEAVEQAREALRFNARSVEVYNELGAVYLDQGDLSMAEFVFSRALDQADGARQDARLISNLGWLYYLRGERLRARNQLEQANEIDPDFLQNLVYLSNLYLDDRNYDDAVGLLERARDAEPENAGVLLNLGIAYRGVGRFDDARVAYEKALSLRPGQVEPLMNLGILYGDYLKDYDKALASFRRYIEEGGENRAAAQEHIESVEREKLRAERQRERDEERKRREEERKERQRTLQQAEKEQPPTPEQQPDQQPEPVKPDPDSPWGGSE